MFSASWYRAWHSSDRANHRAGLLRERRWPGFAGIGLSAQGTGHSARGDRLRWRRARRPAAARRPGFGSRAVVAPARRSLPRHAGVVRLAPLPSVAAQREGVAVRPERHLVAPRRGVVAVRRRDRRLLSHLRSESLGG